MLWPGYSIDTVQATFLFWLFEPIFYIKEKQNEKEKQYLGEEQNINGKERTSLLF